MRAQILKTRIIVKTLQTVSVLMSLFFCFAASAGNEHEHLNYFSDYAEIQASQNLDHYPATKFLGNTPDLLLDLYPPEVVHTFIGKRVPLYVNDKLNLAPIKQQINDLIATMTFDDLANALAKSFPNPNVTAAQVKKSFFDVSPLHRDLFRGYLDVSTIRNRIYTDDPSLILKTTRKTLLSSPTEQSTKTIFTVPDFLLKRELLEPIKNDFEANSHQVQFYASVVRKKINLSDAEFASKLAFYGQGVHDGWLHGLDLTGSVMEGVAAEKPGQFEQLKSYFKFSHDHKSPLRIHMFERANQGAFYDAFWHTMDQCAHENCLPDKIRIGHIQALDEADISRLQKYSHQTQFVFEANVESNLVVHKADLKKIVSTIENLHRSKMSVVLGSDGFGILGADSGFLPTLIKLKKAGLSEGSLNSIIGDAYKPIAGTVLTSAQRLRWQHEESKVRHTILGTKSSFHAVLHCPTAQQILNVVVP